MPATVVPASVQQAAETKLVYPVTQAALEVFSSLSATELRILQEADLDIGQVVSFWWRKSFPGLKNGKDCPGVV